jgi:adenosylcobyric acid synthase
MVQGTGSHVGKSLLVTAFCRIFRQKGYRVAPFKAQNMALNSFVTEDGGEMGRAQVVQAEAAGITPSVDMNPVLIKPQSDTGAQVIIQGKVVGNYSAVEYHEYKKEALKAVKESYKRLSREFDLIVIEGAGSPVEINLKKNDIVNMRMARIAQAPVLIVSDIDRGGVFASCIGTWDLFEKHEKARVKGFIINKFRGDLTLLKPGLSFIKRKTGIPVLGVVPFLKDIYMPDEDSVSLEKKSVPASSYAIDIVVIKLPHISNFTDFDPLEREEEVSLRYVKDSADLGSPDVLIIPGSKNTIGDLHYLKESGYPEGIKRLKRKGTTIVGICGGFQMLGKTIADYHGVESSLGCIEGLGLLDIETQLERKKTTFQVEAIEINTNGKKNVSEVVRGYEIHMGKTKLNAVKSLFKINKRSGKKCAVNDGAFSKNGQVWGTYIHGIFDNDGFRRKFINRIHIKKRGFLSKDMKGFDYHALKEENYNKLADTVRNSIDMKRIYAVVDL